MPLIQQILPAMITTKSGDTLTVTAALIDGETSESISGSMVASVWVRIGSQYEWTLSDAGVSISADKVTIALTSAQTEALVGNKPIFVKVKLTDGIESTIVDGEVVQFTESPLTEDH